MGLWDSTYMFAPMVKLDHAAIFKKKIQNIYEFLIFSSRCENQYWKYIIANKCYIHTEKSI